MPRWTLLNLLIAAATIPVAIYMLVKANATLAGIAVLLAFAVWIAALVIGLTGRGKQRVFAAGALAALTIYAGLVLSEEQFSLTQSKLPTSGLLYYAHEACVTEQSPREYTGPSVTVRQVLDAKVATPLLPPPLARVVPFMTVTEETPTSENFAIVGHVYWGLLFATICGCFACWIAKAEPMSTALRPTSDPDATDAAQ